MRTNKLIYLAVILLLIQGLCFAQQNNNKLDSLKLELSKFIEKQMKSTKTVGLSLALVDNQDVVWSEGFGFADRENQIKATPNTIYRVGSISKLFTSASIMQLAEEGKLDIDSPIQNYIPEFKIKNRFENKESINPRNIMTHHSGLPSDIFFQFFSTNPEPFNSIVEHLNEEYTCTSPNTIFSYSNAGYSLLGVLTEKISHENFLDYTQKHLFVPLAMVNSSFSLKPEMENLYAKGYAKNKKFNEPMIRDVPAGMLHSNVLDLANFEKMTFNNGKFGENQIIGANTLREMQSKQNINCALDGGFQIGLCWFINPSDWKYAGNYAEHGGDTYVYHGQLSTLTDQKIGVIVLTNTDNGAVAIRTIADEVLKKYLKMKTGLANPQEEKKKQKPEYAKDNDKKLSEIAGDYIMGNELFVLLKKGNKLITKQKGAKIILRETNRGSYFMKAKILGLIPVKMRGTQLLPVKINGTEYISVINNEIDTLVIGVRSSKQRISDIWKNRVGNYKITNDTDSFKLISEPRVFEKNGYLQFEFKIFGDDKATGVLKPISENEAIIDGIGRNTGNTVFFNGNEIYFSGIRMQKTEDKKK
jgi:CubicO group peptidase (beta-lactamase class C family)